MRQSVTQSLLPFIQRLPENGQQNLMDDFIASHAGQSAVGRYNPRNKNSMLASDQRERAMNQIANAKVGMIPTISSSQNPFIFAGLFLQAATQAVNTVQQGADPTQVVGFLDIIGPAIKAQLQRMSGDPLRKQAAKLLEQQADRLAQITDKLKKMIQQKAQQQQQQGKKTAQVMNDMQLANLETQSKIQDRNLKTRAALADKQVRTRQQLALADAKTASDLKLQHFRALNE